MVFEEITPFYGSTIQESEIWWPRWNIPGSLVAILMAKKKIPPGKLTLFDVSHRPFTERWFFAMQHDDLSDCLIPLTNSPSLSHFKDPFKMQFNWWSDENMLIFPPKKLNSTHRFQFQRSIPTQNRLRLRRLPAKSSSHGRLRVWRPPCVFLLGLCSEDPKK